MLNEIEAVDEIIAQETAGAEVEALKAEIAAFRSAFRYRCDALTDIAKLLAEAGGYDRRTKNEVLLRVIGMLLMHANCNKLFTRNIGPDDIPF